MERGAAEESVRPVSPAPSTTALLLKWRLGLVVAVAVTSWLAHWIGLEIISGAGLIGSLGLMVTLLAAGWAATMASLPERPLLAGQLLADVAALTLVVHFTGGPYSIFPLFFCVPILLAAALLNSRWSVILAGAAAIGTGGGHFGLALGWLLTGRSVSADYLQGWPVVVTALHVGLFLVVGMISGDLAAKIARRKAYQERTELQFRKARCEVRNILDNIRSGLISIDRDGVITRVNPTCCRILQANESDLQGRNISVAMQGGLEELASLVLPVAAGGPAVQRGEIVVERYGRELPLGLNVNPLTSPRGKVIGAIAIFADLTKEKEMRKRIREADRLAAIGELAASIAHEIRNPLASIRGSVELLAGDLELEGYQTQLFELVLKESGRVNTIINDFLNYSRMKPATLRRFYAGEFRDEIALLVRQHVTAKHGRVDVLCDIEPETLEVAADPEQLTQLTLNLCINACEAMAYQGQLHLALRQLDAGRTCELTVSDNGPGIDPEIRDDLLTPFKTTKEGGTGLGLSVVARIASAHGGEVVIEEAPGGGACFRIRWPQKNKHELQLESIGAGRETLNWADSARPEDVHVEQDRPEPVPVG